MSVVGPDDTKLTTLVQQQPSPSIIAPWDSPVSAGRRNECTFPYLGLRQFVWLRCGSSFVRACMVRDRGVWDIGMKTHLFLVPDARSAVPPKLSSSFPCTMRHSCAVFVLSLQERNNQGRPAAAYTTPRCQCSRCSSHTLGYYHWSSCATGAGGAPWVPPRRREECGTSWVGAATRPFVPSISLPAGTHPSDDADGPRSG